MNRARRQAKILLDWAVVLAARHVEYRMTSFDAVESPVFVALIAEYLPMVAHGHPQFE